MKKIILTISLIMIFVLSALPVTADDPSIGGSVEVLGENYTLAKNHVVEDVVVFGGKFKMEENSRVDGDVAIQGGEFQMDENCHVDGDVVMVGGLFKMDDDSTVNGDVIVFGGNAKIQGYVDGDVVAIGGKVKISDEGVVTGDVKTLGGTIETDESALILGERLDNPFLWSDFPTLSDEDFEFEHHGTYDSGEETEDEVSESESRGGPRKWKEHGEWRHYDHQESGFFFGSIKKIIMSILVAFLAALMVALFPRHISTIEDTMRNASLKSFFVGLITPITAVVLMVALSLFCWLIIPAIAAIAIPFILIGAVFVGKIVVGKLLGHKIFSAFHITEHADVSATLLGVLVLDLFVMMPFIGYIPIVGPFLNVISTIIGFMQIWM